MRISDWSSDVCSSDLIYGDIGAEQAIALVGKTFGALPPRKDAPVDPANVKTAFPAHNEAPLVLRHKGAKDQAAAVMRSEEHTSELQSLMRISYAVFCLKKKKSSTRTRDNARSINK